MAGRKMILPRVDDRYGRWVVVADAGFIPRDGGRLRPVALCKCDCGTERKVTLVSLRCGNSLSCGCLVDERARLANTKHGLKNHPAYPLYSGVYDRCYNSNSKDFVRYGARGVSMCGEWKGSPEMFVRWCISNGWKKGLQIDRKDNDKNYSPANCRFVTAKVNCRNRRNSRVWMIKGNAFDSMGDAAISFEVNKTTISRWCGRKFEGGIAVGKRHDCYSYLKYPKSKEMTE